MFIVDSHCHLNLSPLKEDINSVIQRAAAADVMLMQTICTKITEFDSIKKVAEIYENIYASVGVHPHEVEKEGVLSAFKLISLASHPKVIGIGETGLDYFYEHSNRILQQESLRNHIAAARETGLPIIIHNRDSDEDMKNILHMEMKKGEFKGVIHCFTSTADFAKAALDLGFYISISGIITFKNATALQEVVRTLPLDRLLIETDSPYLAPEPMRGRKNEPAFTKYVVTYLAGLLNKPADEIAELTTNNFFKLFDKCKRI